MLKPFDASRCFNLQVDLVKGIDRLAGLDILGSSVLTSPSKVPSPYLLVHYFLLLTSSISLRVTCHMTYPISPVLQMEVALSGISADISIVTTGSTKAAVSVALLHILRVLPAPARSTHHPPADTAEAVTWSMLSRFEYCSADVECDSYCRALEIRWSSHVWT